MITRDHSFESEGLDKLLRVCFFAIRDSGGRRCCVRGCWWAGTRQRGELLEQCSSILRMTDSVNDWIVNCIGFGEQRTPDSEERTDLHEIEYASGVDDQIRCPGHEP